MGTLALFQKELMGKPITPDGKWWHYFNSKDIEQLGQEITKYKEAGYIDFDEKTERVMYIGVNDAPNTHQIPTAFVIKEIHTPKVTDDLTEYLENWCNNELLTNPTHKSNDSAYQRDKLLAALAQIYKPRGIFHIKAVDIFGDSTEHEPSFWETVLAPQLVDGQYRIRQMGYDTSGRGQPLVKRVKRTVLL